MTLLIEDSPRNLKSWILESSERGICDGAVLTPFATPWVQHSGAGRKPCMSASVESFKAAGINVWFDPTTHALQMSGVGDFRYYDEYDLWGGPRGHLTDSAYIEEHVRKVFSLQTQVDVPHLAPTILLHAGLSNDSQCALEIAREAIRQDPQCWLSIAGTTPFWSSGRNLDAHIGSLASLEPAGWFLTVARPLNELPVAADIEETHGLCRTARALGEDATVHISHGDLAALPAVAAGASSIGTGWDKRQRVCAFTDYAPRGDSTPGGGWYQRATLERLLGSLSSSEASLLESRDGDLTGRLGGIPSPGGPKESFFHHAQALTHIINDVTSADDPESRFHRLLDLYLSAQSQWPEVSNTINAELGSAEWISPLVEGLRSYARSEGWA